MPRLTKGDISADISFLMEAVSSRKEEIPSFREVFLLSVSFPVFTFLLSCINSISFYFINGGGGSIYVDFYDYFSVEGWVYIAPSIVTGFVFFIMAYFKGLTYLSIPSQARKDSIILSHLNRLASRTVLCFVFLMIFMSAILPLFNFSIYVVPALEFALIFILNMALGFEISRLGVGFALEKLTAILNKI